MTDQTPRPDAGPQKRAMSIYRSEQSQDAAGMRAAADRDARRTGRDAKRATSAPPLAAATPPRAPRKRRSRTPSA